MKYDYIVAFYLEERRSKFYVNLSNSDKFFLVKSHLEFLSKNIKQMKDLNKVYFTFNVNSLSLSLLNEIKTLVNTYSLDNIIEIDLRDNKGFSYGAWQHTLINNLQKPNNPEYAFLCEDDYIPTDVNFHLPFIKKFKSSNVSYVASLVWDSPTKHASISNGFIKYSICKELYEEEQKIFSLLEGNDYYTGVFNQVHFLDPLILRSEIADISDEYKIPFYELSLEVLTYYGNLDGKIVIKPITLQDSISLEKITKKDLPFINEVRNEVCKEYLHDSQIFTLKQTEEWFEKTNPMFYMIKFKDENVGYFRTSNYSKENKNIYIGADLHKDWRGKGIAKEAYKMFINFLFETLNFHKISLEVLSTNETAYNLYLKLGFIEEGKKRQEVLKDNVWVDSIIMSILKSEWNN